MKENYFILAFFLIIMFVLFRVQTVNAQTGNVGIGTSNPTEKLDVDGNIKASGAVIPGFISDPIPGAVRCKMDTATGTLKLQFYDGGIWVEVSTGGSSEVVPTGMIMSRLDTIVPSGWARCDGSNGTPDLQGKTLMGGLDLTQTGVIPGAYAGGYPSKIVIQGRYFINSSENTWDLRNSLDSVVTSSQMSGIAHQCCDQDVFWLEVTDLPPDTYTFNAYDSGGDGWNPSPWSPVYGWFTIANSHGANIPDTPVDSLVVSVDFDVTIPGGNIVEVNYIIKL